MCGAERFELLKNLAFQRPVTRHFVKRPCHQMSGRFMAADNDREYQCVKPIVAAIRFAGAIDNQPDYCLGALGFGQSAAALEFANEINHAANRQPCSLDGLDVIRGYRLSAEYKVPQVI